MSEIWLVNQYAITPEMSGGTRHYDLGVELARRGFRVKIFASAYNALTGESKLGPGEMSRVELRDGIEFVWVRAEQYSGNNWRRINNMLSFARNFMKVAPQYLQQAKPAAILGSSPHPFAALAAQRIAAKAGAKFILELRDLWPQALMDMRGLSEWHPGVICLRWIERYLYARADEIVILARGSQNYLLQRRVSPTRVSFIPNGVHLGHFLTTTARSQARNRYGFERFTVIYAGAHGPANSLETILKAAAKVTDLAVEFVLVGAGPSKTHLESMAAEMGLRNVKFLAPVPKGEVADLLNAADAGVITLLNAKAFAYGVSPNKLFDYMAAGKPILCSVPGDMATMVEEAGAGLVCTPEDPDALAEATRRLFSLSEPERARFGANGRDFLEAHFRREVLVDRLANLLPQ